jgi:type IV pilus assembly protein PilW
MKAQQGYTLLELMIALTLGLLVSAAATQLLVTGGLTLNTQQNASDIQDNVVFGMELVNRQIRQANAGNSIVVNNIGLQNGLVFDKASVDGAINTIPLTAQDTNISRTADAKSDQIVIQYQALQGGMRDCEGNNIVSGSVVVERYFLRLDNLSNETPKPLALACAAATTATLNTFNTATGSILLGRAEDMRVLLGTTTAANLWQYYSINQYLALPTKPTIRTIKLGVLVRSNNEDNSTKTIKKSPNYYLLDQTVTVGGSDGFVRRVFTSTVSLRNSLGG